LRLLVEVKAVLLTQMTHKAAALAGVAVEPVQGQQQAALVLKVKVSLVETTLLSVHSPAVAAVVQVKWVLTVLRQPQERVALGLPVP
jgi:hypothetical protein